MKKLAVAAVALCIAAIGGSARSQTTETASIASVSDKVFDATTIRDTMRRVCDYGISITTETGRNNWIRAAFYTGVMATYYTTGDEKYLKRSEDWGAEAKWTPNQKDPRHADNQACGQTYCEVHALKPNPQSIEPLRKVADQMIEKPLPGRVEWWWCDALFMAPPALVRLAAVTSDTRYIDLMNDLYWDTTDHLFDSEEGLFYRDANYFSKKTVNGKKIFWSRGNGWVFAGLARVLQYLPENNPRRRDFVKLYLHMASSLARLQREDGTWGPSLHDPVEFPTKESSGTGFFCYGFAWGINNGLLNRERYLPVVEKAWAGLQTMVDEKGKVGYAQKVAGSPGQVDPAATAEYAIGAFLLAGSEVIRLKNPDFVPPVTAPLQSGGREAFDLFKAPAQPAGNQLRLSLIGYPTAQTRATTGTATQP